MQYFSCLFFACCLLGAPAFAQSPVTGNPDDLPFTLELEEATQDELPGIHSAAAAQWNGWWVFVGGRIGGLHGFFPFTAFPETEANSNILLINPENGDLHSFGVDVLNVPFHDPLKATNPQSAQDGEYLYVCGGYGKDAATGNFVTFSVLTAIHLPTLVSAITGGQNPSAAFQQIQSDKFRACGGEMEKMGDYFYLVGGHDFSGNYTQVPSPMFTQVYTNDIRKFRIDLSGGNLAVADYSVHHDEQNLHRRDFTLAPLMRPGETPGLGLYGGVFRPDADLPYYNPVYITENQILNLDASYAQIFSQYTCPALPLFDAGDGAMYTVFFAGLSAHYYDQNSQSIKYDERVPFIRDISTFRRLADGSSKEYLMPEKFDALLGANMFFMLSEEAPHYANEVIKLQELQGKTQVGWLFGGIKAEIPNITPSSANNRLFKVYIYPKNSSGTATAPTGAELLVSPNPLWGGQKVQVSVGADVEQLLLCNAGGQVLARLGADADALARALERVAPGVYIVQAQGAQGKTTHKILKM